MNSKVDIKGDAGVSVNSNHGKIEIQINQIVQNPDTRTIDQLHKIAVGQLFGSLKKYDLRESLESISEQMFGTIMFNTLSIEQLKHLQLITSTINTKLDRVKILSVEKHEEDEKQFAKTTGIRGTTAPSRAAIRLLLEENVNTQTIKTAWNDGLLIFNNNYQFEVRVPNSWGKLGKVLALIGFIIMVAPVLLLMYYIPSYSGHMPKSEVIAYSSFQVFAGLVSGTFLWNANKFIAPYRAVKQITLHIEKVNRLLVVSRDNKKI